MSYDPDNFIWRKASKSNTQNWLGIGVNPDFVKKDGSVSMTDSLQIYKTIQSDFFSGNLQLKSNDVYSSLSLGIGDIAINYSTFIQAYQRQNNNAIDLLLNPLGGSIGIGVTSTEAKLHVNGNVIVDDGTLAEHTVNLGQVNGWGLGTINAPLVTNNTHGLMNGFYRSQSGNINVFVNSFASVYHADWGGGYSQDIIIGDNGRIAVGFSSPNNTTYQFKELASLDQVANGNTAYNERVTQFNTTYTSNVYTFSILLANGVQKQTTLQTSATHFTINGSGVLQLNAAIAQKISDAVTAADVSSMGYQTASQVSNAVLNQISNLGLAPNPHLYDNITVNSTVIDVSEFRRAVIVFSDPSVTSAALSNNAYPGTVVTLQTTSVQVDVTMDYRKPTSSGAMLPIEAYKSVQLSYSQDQNAWIVEQDNSLS